MAKIWRGVVGATAVALVASIVAVAPAAAVAVEAHGSVGQVYVLHATPGATITLHDASDAQIASEAADSQGGALFRNLTPGGGYEVRQNGTPVQDGITVLDPAVPPSQSLYDGQDLVVGDPDCGVPPPFGGPCDATAGYQYVETRDGTTLSVNVQPPFFWDSGTAPPFPVLINYSGYTPSAPGNQDPLDVAARAAGFGVVGVNMRGTGCSGGAYDYFEYLQSLDAYDVIETIAAQDWSTGVGMAGISFPGISQLFSAQTRPPHLDAIAPLSVIADTYRSTLYPGGILNNGFAAGWAADRDHSAEPSGQSWAATRIANGDDVCEDNQLLKLQADPIVPRLLPDAFRQAPLGDLLAPQEFVDEIDVPTFIAGAFQDEQTGPHFATMLDRFTRLGGPGKPLRVELMNGHHSEALAPDIAQRLLEFLNIYVGHRHPNAGMAPNSVLRLADQDAFAQAYGGSGMDLPPPRSFPSDPTAARAAWEAEPPVRVSFEHGAAGTDGADCPDDNPANNPNPCPAGYPYSAFTQTFSAWPPPGTTAEPWYLQPDGALAPTATTIADDEPRGFSTYHYDGSTGGDTSYHHSNESLWTTQPDYDWEPNPEGNSLAYLSPPLAGTEVFAGSGSVDLWVRSSAADVDFQVDLTEVRPDGQEMYIQSGWLRASHRAEAPESSVLEPVHTHLQSDAAPLPDGEFVPLRVEIFPFAHIVRAGSQIRLTVRAPGGSRPFWQFDALEYPGDETVDVAHSVGRPSRLVLPRQPGIVVPTSRPECNEVRGQPCRDLVASRAPTGVTTEVVDREVQVSWNAPEAGGQTGYVVTVQPTGETFPVDSGQTSFTYVGPDPGTEYSFSVHATFGDGDGPESDASLLSPPFHGFSDVAPAAWYEQGLNWVKAYDVVSGFPNNTYRPQQPVNRAQMASFLWHLMGEPAATGDGQHFSDVPAGAWYDAALDWAQDENVITGFPDGTYHPKDPVNRAQMARMLHRVSGELATGLDANSFTDVPNGIWYEQAVDWLTTDGIDIASGFPDLTFRPRDPVKRSQAASWLWNLARTEPAWESGYPF